MNDDAQRRLRVAAKSMPDLLGRQLTRPEQLAKAALERAASAPAPSRDTETVVSWLRSGDPELFTSAVLAALGEQQDPLRRRIYEIVADDRDFWTGLVQSNRFTPSELLAVCRYLMTIDQLLDVRLAHLTPGRHSDAKELEAGAVLRILDLLDALSPGNRLILLLNHLTAHADPRIAAKATLVIGRRLRNPDWVAHHLDSADGRVRASTVEGLWGHRSSSARHSLWTSLKDKNNRVVGNALIGLHQLGEPGVAEFVTQMIHDSRPPFRWTAAWVMGQIGAGEFVEPLEQARHDHEATVQRAADRALGLIRQRLAAT